jgi:hypothetical protein
MARRWWSRSGRRKGDFRFDADKLSASPADVHQALQLLPSVLDAGSLPNGVVELVVEDPSTPGRWVLDIHDGRVGHLEPGTVVPWASIAGSHGAWALALGAGQASGLQLTGEEQLAQRLLAALPRPAIAVTAAEQGATV